MKMYNLFNTLRSPNPTLFNLHCSFQPHDMDSPPTFLEEFFCFCMRHVWRVKKRERKGKHSGLITTHYHRQSYVVLTFCQRALPYHTRSLYKNSGQCSNGGIYWRWRNMTIDQVYKPPWYYCKHYIRTCHF